MADTTILLSDLIAQFGGRLVGEDIVVTGISTLSQATYRQLSFLTDNRLKYMVGGAQANAFIVHTKFSVKNYPDKSFIVCDNPYLYYARVSQYFHPAEVSSGIKHASAVIESEYIDSSVEIGAKVTLAKNVKIGACSRVLSGTVIEQHVTIGENCIIHPNVTILQGTIIGDDVEIHSGTVIGSDGFGYAYNEYEWEKIPQVGGVEIYDKVSIGANVAIDRGSIGNTIIRTGVKIDNLVQIAHNCEIGEYTAIAAMVGMAGSTKIGKNCRIGGAAKFTGHLSVADHICIAGATIVSHTIAIPGGRYAGFYPCQTHREWKYNAVYLKKLKIMNQRLQTIEKNAQQDFNNN